MAGADFGEARDGAGAAAGSARGRVAWNAARGIDVRNEISAERWQPIRRGGRLRGAGAGNLVEPAAGMDFENSRDDGNFAQGLSLGCGESPMCRGELPAE